jgi:hypothetical protein
VAVWKLSTASRAGAAPPADSNAATPRPQHTAEATQHRPRVMCRPTSVHAASRSCVVVPPCHPGAHAMRRRAAKSDCKHCCVCGGGHPRTIDGFIQDARRAARCQWGQEATNCRLITWCWCLFSAWDKTTSRDRCSACHSAADRSVAIQVPYSLSSSASSDCFRIFFCPAIPTHGASAVGQGSVDASMCSPASHTNENKRSEMPLPSAPCPLSLQIK